MTGDEHEADGAMPEVDPEAVAEEVDSAEEVAEAEAELEAEFEAGLADEDDDEALEELEDEDLEDEELELEEHGEVAAEADDDVHAQAEEQPQPDEPVEDVPADGDDAGNDALRESLSEMRGEADRIASLGTGQEQVEAAEAFAEDAGRLDEQIGSAARAAENEQL
jgi:hypothetical protein